jgi:nucleotide-binding universal stress UspA family protein
MRCLIAIDGSSVGLSAAKLGGKIAAELGAQVTLLCVGADEGTELEKYLDLASDLISTQDQGFTPIGRRGNLVDEILAQMRAVEYDVAFVGYQPRPFLQKVFRGSLASRIANEVPTSVMILRDERERIEHILVGISGGGFTKDCARWAGKIAAAFGAHVTLAHASQTPALMYGGLEEVKETLEEFLQTDTAQSKALRQAVARLREVDVETEVELVHGLPERELLRMMQDRDADLLIVGSSWAAPPVQRTFLRNITEQVLLFTRRPVLVVRPSASHQTRHHP